MHGKKYKVSFCVVCMNRLHQLKQTLLKNITDNEDYAELEFIVLDYNSQDGMEEWVQENLSQYILNGKVQYYKTTEPESWSPSHSKNLAFKLATGEIVCSIWADYYTGVGFAAYINDEFKKDNNIVLTPIDFPKKRKDYNPPGDVLGKVCVKKSDFLRINGFDERMDRHGFEDYDFINRLEMVDVKRMLIEDFNFLKYIQHDDKERYDLQKENLQGMYINHKTPSVSEVIFLYQDKRFEKGTLIDNFTSDAGNYIYAYTRRQSRFEYSLKDRCWTVGTWQDDNASINFLVTNDINFSLKKIAENAHTLLIDDSGCVYHNLTDQEIIREMLVFKHFYYTRSIMEDNLDNKTAIVNNGNFGRATVYKNFNYDIPFNV